MAQHTVENGLVIVSGAAVPMAAAAGADIALQYIDAGALLGAYGLPIGVLLIGLIYVCIQSSARLLASLGERLRHGMRRDPFDVWLAAWLIALAAGAAGGTAFGRYAYGAAAQEIGSEHVAFGILVAAVFGCLLLLLWIGAADQLARLRAFRTAVIQDPLARTLRDVREQCQRLKEVLAGERERRAGMQQLVGDMDQLLAGFGQLLDRVEPERGDPETDELPVARSQTAGSVLGQAAPEPSGERV